MWKRSGYHDVTALQAKPNNMETTQQPQKRPVGMTILLVLSFLNACLNIFSSLIMYFSTPMLSEMMRNGQFEDTMSSITPSMNEEMRQSMIDTMNVFANIKPVYYLFILLLFVASLVGVLRMFKWNKTGFHIYAIAQMLILIVSSIYRYPLMHPSPFTTDLLLTAMFIAVYYMYFKRMEMQGQDGQKDNFTNPFEG